MDSGRRLCRWIFMILLNVFRWKVTVNLLNFKISLFHWNSKLYQYPTVRKLTIALPVQMQFLEIPWWPLWSFCLVSYDNRFFRTLAASALDLQLDWDHNSLAIYLFSCFYASSSYGHLYHQKVCWNEKPTDLVTNFLQYVKTWIQFKEITQAVILVY